MTYAYACGNLLESPNNYFFSSTGGPTFLDSYERSRKEMIELLRSRINESAATECSLASNGLLNDCAIEAVDPTSGRERLELILRRFAVTKKVWSQYGVDARPLGPATCEDLRYYLRFAAILASALATHGDVRYLNGLLQVNDIVQAHAAQLEPEQLCQASFLLQFEIDWVEEIRAGLR
jgi:hypothetical protein